MPLHTLLDTWHTGVQCYQACVCMDVRRHPTQVLDFTHSIGEVRKFLMDDTKMRATGGGDGPEDVAGALLEVGSIILE